MLTEQILKANETLSGLTTEQLSAIVTLSERDENNTIAKRIGEIYSGLDADIENTFGIKKPQGLKTYEFIKQLPSLGNIADSKELKQQIETLQTDKQKLEQQLKEGQGNEGLKSQIAQLEKFISEKDATIKQMQDNQTSSLQEWQNKYAAKEKQIKDYQINSAFSDFTSGVKFRSDLPEEMVKVFIETQKKQLQNEFEIDLMPNNQGGTNLVFKKDGAVEMDKQTLLPVSGKDLLLNRLKSVIDEGHQQTGTGTAGNISSIQTSVSVNANTQTLAASQIDEQLIKLGFAQGSAAYQQKFDEAYEAYKVAEMPVK